MLTTADAEAFAQVLAVLTDHGRAYYSSTEDRVAYLAGKAESAHALLVSFLACARHTGHDPNAGLALELDRHKRDEWLEIEQQAGAEAPVQ